MKHTHTRTHKRSGTWPRVFSFRDSHRSNMCKFVNCANFFLTRIWWMWCDCVYAWTHLFFTFANILNVIFGWHSMAISTRLSRWFSNKFELKRCHFFQHFISGNGLTQLFSWTYGSMSHLSNIESDTHPNCN